MQNAVWQMVHPSKQIKREAAGKTIRLSYCGRDIQKVGEAAAIGKIVAKPGPSERFEELDGAVRCPATPPRRSC